MVVAIFEIQEKQLIFLQGEFLGAGANFDIFCRNLAIGNTDGRFKSHGLIKAPLQILEILNRVVR